MVYRNQTVGVLTIAGSIGAYCLRHVAIVLDNANDLRFSQGWQVVVYWNDVSQGLGFTGWNTCWTTSS